MTSELDALLKRKAKTWASKLTKLAKERAPKHIAPYITSASTATEGRYQITLAVKPVEKFTETGAISNYGTMDAKAQEYGYPGAHITPRAGRKFLSFPWEVQVVGAGRLPNGNILLKEVHRLPMPAYNEGKGYIRPAVAEWRAELRATETPEIAKAIFADLRKGFKTSGKLKRVFTE